jgi:hypothetical protein
VPFIVLAGDWQLAVLHCRGAGSQALRPSILSNMPTHIRTSFDIPDPLLRKAKAVARARKTTLRQLLLEGLRAVVEERPAQYRLEDHAFGGKGLVEGLGWDVWDEVLRRSYQGRGG